MSIESFFVYIATLFIATIIPGPSMLLALNHGISHGIKHSFATALGNLTANLLMAIISIAGLGAIIIASGTAFQVTKWLGAGYLVFIGIKTWMSPVVPVETATSDIMKTTHKTSTRKRFSEGFLVAAGNPKGIVFFTALLPQFINSMSVSVLQFSMIFLPLVIIAFGCFMLYAVCGQKITFLVKSTSLNKIINRVTGGTFIGLGLIMTLKEK